MGEDIGTEIFDMSLDRNRKALLPDVCIDADQLISQLKAVAENPKALKYNNDSSVHEFQRYAREAAIKLEKPFETLRRIAYCPLPLVVSRIVQEHGIIEALSKGNGSVLIASLCASTNFPPDTLDLLLDYLCTQYMARQVGRDSFEITDLGRELLTPSFQDGFIHHYDNMFDGWGSLSKSLRKPQGNRTAWQMGFRTDLDFYAYMERDEKTMEREAFNRFMKTNMLEMPSWLSVVDFEADFAKDLKDNEVAFVDVGGGNGHQCDQLLSKYPHLRGKVVVQDRPEVLETAMDVEGMEIMPYNYMTEQPVKGARVYYFRSVFHNNTDENCLRILKTHIPAMGPNSVIVIDDKTLPDEKPAADSPGADIITGLSIAMMMFFNARERREAHWRRLIGSAGLKVRGIRKYSDFSESAIIVTKD